MSFPRLGGMVLHPTSLPGGHGVGDLGRPAREFIDFLADAGLGIWQVLPLGPTGGSHSPYQALSSYAGNPILISLDNLAEAELLDARDVSGGPANGDRVDFSRASAFKEKGLRKAFNNFLDGRAGAELLRGFDEFCRVERRWLDDFSLFAAAKDFFKGAPWFRWGDAELRRHAPPALEKYGKLLSREIRYHKFTQFVFFLQWRELRDYAARKAVKFFGDMPIYCAHDSADVWSEPEFFQLDADGNAKFMAGVPPDYFSANGQLWGNPLYDWNAMREDGFRWWRRRLRASLGLADMLRIDHFRGFEAYWAVPKGEVTAINGKWLKGPGQAIFDALREEVGENLPIVAEDLGVITPRVDKLRLDNGFPGMKVLHFAFGGGDAYLPHAYDPNTVCYVATHDNDTTRGWYEAEGPDYLHLSWEDIEAERDRARRYLGRDGSGIAWDLMRLALSSVADTAIITMQDVLDLPNSCRMNRPGLGDGQWRWRLTADGLARANRSGLRDMIELYGRQPEKAPRETARDVETEG